MHPRLHLVLRLQGKRTEIGAHGVNIRLDVRDAGGRLGEGDVARAAQDLDLRVVDEADVDAMLADLGALALESQNSYNFV